MVNGMPAVQVSPDERPIFGRFDKKRARKGTELLKFKLFNPYKQIFCLPVQIFERLSGERRGY